MSMVAAAGNGLGALNEIVRFVAARLTVTNVGGSVNTGWNFAYNTFGAMIAALVLYRKERRTPSRDD